MSAAALVMAACSDDDSTSSGSVDAGTDTGTADRFVPDTGSTDSGNDSGGGTDASDAGGDVDAGPTTTASLGATGRIRVFADAIFGEFLEDQTIVRVSNAPECVAHIWSKSKLFTPSGALTVGGQIVGSDGGPTQAIVVNAPASPDSTGFPYAYFAFDDGITIFPPDDSLTVQVQLAGTQTISAMPAQTLRPPPAAEITVTKPTIPDAGPVIVQSTLPFDITWTAPDAGADERVLVGFTGLVGPQKEAHIFCGYALSKGTATIPANFLAEVRTRLGAAASGDLHIWVGGQKEVVVGQDSFVIEVTRPESTNFLRLGTEPPVTLQ